MRIVIVNSPEYKSSIALNDKNEEVDHVIGCGLIKVMFMMAKIHHSPEKLA
jgi:hypothetical protein